MKYLSAYIYHVRKRTALGRSLLRSPIESFFWIMRGNWPSEPNYWEEGYKHNDLISKLYRWHTQKQQQLGK